MNDPPLIKKKKTTCFFLKKTCFKTYVSKQCSNGLYICSVCGTCCSNDMFKRRLDALILNGGFIYPELFDYVKNEVGHLEKAEYYCYNCGGMMNPFNDNEYFCKKCNVKYDFHKYIWLSKKWKQIHLRRKDYPKNNS